MILDSNMRMTHVQKVKSLCSGRLSNYGYHRSAERVVEARKDLSFRLPLDLQPPTIVPLKPQPQRFAIDLSFSLGFLAYPIQISSLARAFQAAFQAIR